MKAFVASLILLGVLLTGVSVTSLLLSRDAARMTEAAKALSVEEGRAERITLFCDAWERRQAWYMLILNANEIERMDEAVVSMRAAAESKSDSDYKIAVARLQETCSHFHDLVGFRLEQIF